MCRDLKKLLLTAALVVLTCGLASVQAVSQAQTGGSGNQVLYGAPATVLLNEFLTATVDPNTGGFSSWLIGSVPFVESYGMVAVHSQFLYISAPYLVRSGSEIFGYSISPTDGTLTPLAGSPFALPSAPCPQGLATVPGSYFLYAADAGAIDAFRVDSATGVPTPVRGSPFRSGTNAQLVVDPSGKFLYASDDDPPGGILAFKIGSHGALTPVPGSPFVASGSGIANSYPYGIVDTGSFVYAGLTASNQIAAFSINRETGALMPVSGSPFSAGNFPAVLTLARNFLYAVNELDGSISGYNIDSSGALLPVSGFPFGSNAAIATADLSQRYLYVSKLNGLQGYNIDPATGALTEGTGHVWGIDGSQWLAVVPLHPSETANAPYNSPESFADDNMSLPLSTSTLQEQLREPRSTRPK